MNTYFHISEDEQFNEVNENIKLIQKKKGLTFGTDALLLAAFVKSKRRSVAVEFGAGTGIVSFLCATKKKFSKIFAVEVQEEFSDIINRNIELNGLSSVVECINADIRNISPAFLGFEADAVFTNPPYMRKGSGKHNESDIKSIARHEIFGNISDFCASASKILKHGGAFYAVYRPERTAELFDAMIKAGIEPKRIVCVCPDTSLPPSLILVEGKKGAASGLIFETPLFMYSDYSHKSYTAEFEYIYKNGSMPNDDRR